MEEFIKDYIKIKPAENGIISEFSKLVYDEKEGYIFNKDIRVYEDNEKSIKKMLEFIIEYFKLDVDYNIKISIKKKNVKNN